MKTSREWGKLKPGGKKGARVERGPESMSIYMQILFWGQESQWMVIWACLCSTSHSDREEVLKFVGQVRYSPA